MQIMRKPEEKLQAQSVPEVRDALAAEYKRLSRLRDAVRIRGRIVSAGTLLNAIVLEFLALPSREREAIARRGLAVYQRLLDSDPPDYGAGDEESPARVPSRVEADDLTTSDGVIEVGPITEEERAKHAIRARKVRPLGSVEIPARREHGKDEVPKKPSLPKRRP